MSASVLLVADVCVVLFAWYLTRRVARIVQKVRDDNLRAVSSIQLRVEGLDGEVADGFSVAGERFTDLERRMDGLENESRFDAWPEEA